MLFEKKIPLYGYEVLIEGEDNIMRLNYDGAPELPSIEDSPTCMARTCDNLIEASAVTKLVFSQKRDYEYDYHQTALLKEVALLFNSIVKEKEKIEHKNFVFPGISQRFKKPCLISGFRSPQAMTNYRKFPLIVW